jgi:hypothetical protein
MTQNATKQKGILDYRWDRETFPDPRRDTIICEVGNNLEISVDDEVLVTYGAYIVAKDTHGKDLGKDWDRVVDAMTAAPAMLKMLEQVEKFLRDKGAEFFEDHEWRWLVDDISAVINEAKGD